ncbi:MAG: hydroxymethylbilane synthase [Myxococcota bacterium]
MTRIRIATRNSPLALWQAEHIADHLKANDESLAVELVPMVTRGDKILDQALSRVGGKDLFVKEVEHAVLEGRAEVAVHSLKDMPTEMPDGLILAACPPREDPRDALVSPDFGSLDGLPYGATVGTSSLRRGAQLRRLRPDLRVVDIRGNVQTRLQKLQKEGLAATLLAYAGLLRLGMASLATEVFDPGRMLPAVGQGILAVQCRSDDRDTRERLGRLDDPHSRAAAMAERAYLAELEGGCQVPIGGHATVSGDRIELRGMVSQLDGVRLVEGSHDGPVTDASAVGVRLAEDLLARGAKEILDALKG